jgi:hypothetical protein
MFLDGKGGDVAVVGAGDLMSVNATRDAYLTLLRALSSSALRVL